MSAKRKNGSGAKNLKQWLGAVGKVCTKKKQAAGSCSFSNDPEVLAAKKLIDETPAQRRSDFGREQASKRRRRNPGAEEMYEQFHGKPSERAIEIEEEVHYPAKLADLGELIELQVVLPAENELAVLGFRRRGVRLAASGNGQELHFIGGDQAMDLEQLGVAGQAGKPNVLVGIAHKVTYHTSKAFHDFEPADYEHEFGEDTGVKPLLAYDARSRKLYLVGGAYEVRPEGIVN